MGQTLNAYKKSISKDGVLIIDFANVAAGWQQWILLSSDRHWDNPKSNQALQRKHLDEMQERAGLWIDNGDLFCAMQGSKDKRGSKSALRLEHQREDYFNALTETATEFFAPYAHACLLLGRGNHETAIAKHNEIDLTRTLVNELNMSTGSSIHLGGYAGWIRFRFRAGKDGRRTVHSSNLFYHHGYGGAAPVTKGVIQTNRRAEYLPDANIVISGHIHRHWYVPIVRERINTQGSIYIDEQEHVSIPSYKDEWSGNNKMGWHVERGGGPTSVGAVWLRFYYEDNAVKTEFTRAR